MHNPDAEVVDNNLRFPSPSGHVAQVAAVSAAAAVAVAIAAVVRAAACRSSAAWDGTSGVAHSHMGVEVARTQARGVGPAVLLWVRRRIVVALEPRTESAKTRVVHMDW